MVYSVVTWLHCAYKVTSRSYNNLYSVRKKLSPCLSFCNFVSVIFEVILTVHMAYIWLPCNITCGESLPSQSGRGSWDITLTSEFFLTLPFDTFICQITFHKPHSSFQFTDFSHFRDCRKRG